jgi:2'-hydroxyisoflavone reductase
MRLLILGGTQFLGRHLADEALRRGWELTLFNRGQTNPELYPQAKKVRGDRKEAADLERLATGQWDAVVDTSGYTPAAVRASATALRLAAKAYVFISSISVYPDITADALDETAAVTPLEGDDHETVTASSYGPLKALCEDEVRRVYGPRALVIRPGLIVGPHDASDRFTYWTRRLSAGGEVLAPGGGNQAVQLIDARDLARFTLDLIERREGGIYNATGLPTRMRDVLEDVRAATGGKATLVWVKDEAFIEAQGIAPWMGLPLWIPRADQKVDVRRALTAGMILRPTEQTARDTAAWDAGRDQSVALKAGITRESEATVLAAWKAKKK